MTARQDRSCVRLFLVPRSIFGSHGRLVRPLVGPKIRGRHGAGTDFLQVGIMEPQIVASLSGNERQLRSYPRPGQRSPEVQPVRLACGHPRALMLSTPRHATKPRRFISLPVKGTSNGSNGCWKRAHRSTTSVSAGLGLDPEGLDLLTDGRFDLLLFRVARTRPPSRCSDGRSRRVARRSSPSSVRRAPRGCVRSARREISFVRSA